MTSLTLKDLNKIPVRLASGHRLCAGCAESIIAKQILMGTEDHVAVSASTGCFEVSTTIFPYTAWNTPFIHTAFGNGAATCAGLETAYNALKKKGKVEENIKFVNFAGDGATYDIGLQALSGAMERGHRMMYVCLNNEAYMNTGIQRSSATPTGASTTTSWAGTVSPGKKEFSKDMTEVMIAHNIPYVAQVSPHNALPQRMEVPLRRDHLHLQAGSGDLCLAPVRGRRRTVLPDRRVREDRLRKGREEAYRGLDQLPGKVQAPPAGEVGTRRGVHPG